MNIALVNHTFSLTHGGLERFSVNLATMLHQEGHSVHVFAHRWQDLPDGIQVHAVPMAKRPSSWRVLSFARNARILINQGDYDVVYGLTRSASERLWKRTGFYRALNRMLFLAAGPQERRQVLERFYKLRPGLIARFYAGENTLLDKLRILSGKPPVKMSRAYKAVFGYQSGSARPT